MIPVGMVVRRAAVPALAALALAGCDYLPFGYTPIREIVAAPANFEGREVKIKGTAKALLQLPGFRAYLLEDDTVQVAVVTAGELPASGSAVTLKGTVKSAVIIGGQSLGLRVEETKRLR